MHSEVELLRAWESFNVIVGSSAAAMTGLQFVAIVLMAETTRRFATAGVGAFATPTIVHFGAVLLISAFLTAPWPALYQVAIALGVVGLIGLVYVPLVVMRSARSQQTYRMVLEDWLFHIVGPFVAYGGLFAAALVMRARPAGAMFGVGAVQLALLIIGIHNAWDTVTFTAISHITARAASVAGNPETRAADEPPESA
jgi:hypothetical protein